MAPTGTTFHVFASSGVPIYRQIMDQVAQLAATGRIKPGDYLPSIRTLAKELAVNPMTISKAYAILEREGVLENVRGQGVRLAQPKTQTNDAATLATRSESMAPLLRDVVARAYQSGLSPEQTIDLLKALFHEAQDDNNPNQRD